MYKYPSTSFQELHTDFCGGALNQTPVVIAVIFKIYSPKRKNNVCDPVLFTTDFNYTCFKDLFVICFFVLLLLLFCVSLLI